MAVSVRAPVGSLLVGVSPLFAWGAAAGLVDVMNMREGTDFRGDLVIHQSQTPDQAELRMKFKPEDHGAFPLGFLLGVVRVKAVAPPNERCGSPWALPGFWHWSVCWPRPFREPLRWGGALGLFEVESKRLRDAVADAEYEARSLWRSLPEGDREAMVERAAIAEDAGVSPGLANRQAIEEFQAARMRRLVEDGNNREGAREYGKHRRG